MPQYCAFKMRLFEIVTRVSLYHPEMPLWRPSYTPVKVLPSIRRSVQLPNNIPYVESGKAPPVVSEKMQLITVTFVALTRWIPICPCTPKPDIPNQQLRIVTFNRVSEI